MTSAESSRPLPVATVPPAFTWASQVRQYPKIGPSGLSVFEGDMRPLGYTLPVLCLCWRDARGLLRGVLNYYQETTEWEDAGNANVFVDPEWYGRGIGTVLLLDAVERFGLDLHRQRFTQQGAAFMRRLIEKGVIEW